MNDKRIQLAIAKKEELEVKLNKVKGTPKWLFKLPWFFSVWNVEETVAYIISLVVVFPTLPVTPIYGISNFSL